MKITIKNYRSCRSNEGDAFSCSVYINGKRAALVQYDGWGGDYLWDWTPADKCRDGGATKEKYDKHVMGVMTSEPDYKKGDEKKSFFLSCGRDIVLERVINDMLDEKELKKLCKKHIVYRCKGDEEGTWRTWKNEKFAKGYGPYHSVRTMVRMQIEEGLKKHGLKLEEILNGRVVKLEDSRKSA